MSPDNCQRRFDLAAVLLIIAIGFIIYAVTLTGEFVWDDYHLVQKNQYIKNWHYLGNIFSEDTGSGAGLPYYSFRPLQLVTYLIDYSLWQLNSFGFHLTNTILHLLTALCIFWLLKILFHDCLLSLFTSLLFICHPIQTEAVAYISGRSDPLSAVFLFLALIFYFKQYQIKSNGYFLLMIMTYTLSLLSRENCLILPLLIIAYHFSYRIKIKKYLFFSILSTAFIYILCRLTFLKFISGGKLSATNPLAALAARAGYETSIAERLPGAFAALANYLRLLLLPFGLHMEYGAPLFNFSDPSVISGVLITLIFIFFIHFGKKHSPIASFSLLWFLIAIFPVLNIYPVINAYMAEHWLYLPALGFFLLAAKLFRITYDRFKKLAVFSFTILLLFYSIITINQNYIWTNSLRLYEYTVTHAPENWRAYDNLGYIYMEKGLREKAIPAFIKAAELMGGDNAADYYILANKIKKFGCQQEAIKLYQQALAKDPGFIDAHINLGNTYLELGEKKKAINQYQQALTINPQSTAALFNLANAYIAEGDLDQAAARLQQIIELDPFYLDAYNNLGNIYKINNKLPEAIALFEKVIKINPDYDKAYYNLGDIYRKIGEDDLAVKNFVIATAINPRYAKAYHALALVYWKQGKYDLARKHYQKAYRLGVVDSELIQTLNSKNNL